MVKEMSKFIFLIWKKPMKDLNFYWLANIVLNLSSLIWKKKMIFVYPFIFFYFFYFFLNFHTI